MDKIFRGAVVPPVSSGFRNGATQDGNRSNYLPGRVESMSYKIEQIEGIGPSYAEKLVTANIKTTNDLLKLCCDAEGRRKASVKTGVSEGQLLKWVNMADLMRISGVGSEFSELLEAAGVDTVKELRTRNPENLAAKMKEINDQKKLTRATPSVKVVTKWVEQAGKLEPVISH